MSEEKRDIQHVERRKKVNSLDRDTIEKLIDLCALRNEDTLLLRYKHINHYDENYIADTLGWSVRSVRRHYIESLKKLYRIAELHECFND